MTDGEQTRHRRRQRRPRSADPAAPAHLETDTGPAHDATAAASGSPATPGTTGRQRRPREGGSERGLRDLVGAGRSQLGVSGALRARDVNRPTEADLAEAERDVVIVRRHWKPADRR